MTDKDIIKKEIEKLIERAKAERVLHPKTILAAKNYLLIEDYNKLISFIDSLPGEPVSEDRKETILKKAHELANKAERISGVFPKSTLIAVACDMAEWCDTHPIEEPVSEDLEEAAENFADGEWDGLHDNDGESLFTGDYIQYTFKAGAQWQKQMDDEAKRHIHKNAVEYGKRQIINVACEYLREQTWPDNKIDDFRKALEED